MNPLFMHYPKCSTCKKAFKYLKDAGIQYEERHIVEQNPTKEELLTWIDRSGLEFKKFFNTSGQLYREMGLKDRIKDMSLDEAAELLATNGMLVKRPLVVTDSEVIVGFKEEAYAKLH
ncbi:MAG: arsenate reductase family protein [Cellulosilyticaceae bacterium]